MFSLPRGGSETPTSFNREVVVALIVGSGAVTALTAEDSGCGFVSGVHPERS